MIYFDNAASGWPKPAEVLQAVMHYMEHVGANPGRSGHQLSVEAARIVYETREGLAELLGVSGPLRIVFGPNATEALNLALLGLLRPGDHVITSSMEHNSVMRPLRELERHGVKVSVIHCSPQARSVRPPAGAAAAPAPAPSSPRRTSRNRCASCSCPTLNRVERVRCLPSERTITASSFRPRGRIQPRGSGMGGDLRS